MTTKLGVVVVALCTMLLVLLYGNFPIGESVWPLLLAIVFLSIGRVALSRTRQLISPIFASSRFPRWLLRGFGLITTLIGLAGFIYLAGSALGFQ